MIILIQFVCLFHIGCKTILQLKFKFKFVFTQAFLIFWIQTPIGLSLHHSCDNSQLFVLYVHNNCKNSFVYNICFSFISSSPISTLFAKIFHGHVLVYRHLGKFIFLVWPWRPEALHSCDNSDSICLSFPHWLHEKFILNSISSPLISTYMLLLKYKFIFIQKKLIFSIPSPDIKFMWFHLSIISTVIA